MLDLAVHMVVRDDVFYLPMALQSVLPHVRGIFIQDQMSQDGTYEIAQEFAQKFPGQVIVERVDTGCPERFTPNYDEPKFRTMAVKRTEEIFKTAWLLKCDADEIYSEYFFKSLEQILPNAKFESVRVSGERFISPALRAMNGVTILEHAEFSPQGGRFVDPHTQVWRAGKYYYAQNPGLPDTFLHPVLTPQPNPEYWLPGICNIHLHRTFGPKAFKFWAEGGDIFEEKTPFHPPTMAPKWYYGSVNIGSSEKVDFAWPEFVMEKWRSWGIWE